MSLFRHHLRESLFFIILYLFTFNDTHSLTACFEITSESGVIETWKKDSDGKAVKGKDTPIWKLKMLIEFKKKTRSCLLMYCIMYIEKLK